MLSNEAKKEYSATLNKTYLKYLKIEPFVEKYNDLDFIEFIHYALEELSLFSMDLDLDFNLLELYIKEISSRLNAIKNIFSKPLLHLKEEAVIMPVEAVRHINKDTIEHIGTHSELWANISNNNIKPSKLLTRLYKDDYGIYENLIFCDTVDMILEFSRNSIRSLKDLIVTKQIIEVNLLERVHHLQYFLALGKLYTGYIKYFDQYYEVVQKYLAEIDSIYNIIKVRLRRPVYKNNKKRRKNLKLRKTNILSMHKDYNKIYTLHKFLNKKKVQEATDFSLEKLNELSSNYFNYTIILIIFALNHFNFKLSKNNKINFNNLDLTFKFKSWTIEITNRKISEIDVLLLNITKDREIKIVLVPVANYLKNREELNMSLVDNLKVELSADEYLFCIPHEYDEILNNEIFISISNVDSFRRIQQVILKYMIYSDSMRIDCPYCANNLTISLEGDTYICNSCRTIITDTECPNTNRAYAYTNILNYNYEELDEQNYTEDDLWLYNRKVESQMYFRNINKLTKKAENICPHCNEVHN